MNLALLTLAALARRRTGHWPAAVAPVAALIVLSVETQLATLAGMPLRLWHLAIAHGVLAAALVASGAARARVAAHLQSLRPGPVNRTALVILAGVMAVLVARAVLFVPESADPYHLVKTTMLADELSLAHVPVLDSKINVLGYLYELALADLALGTWTLQEWLGLTGPLLVGIYLLAVVTILGRTATALPWYAVLLPCLVPAVFHQGVLIKNDLFAALLALPALLSLRYPRPQLDPLIAGALAGLAMSVKATMAPVALALACFLPWQPVNLAVRTRLRAAAGLVFGLVLGGLAYVSAANVVTYGNIAGPIADSGNLVAGVGDAAVSLGRFVMSWFDASLLTRSLWPDRGGWGGAFGPAFVWALAVLIVARHRVLGVTLVCLLPFGLLYPDADLAHRLALAPAMLAILVAVEIEAARGAFSRWSLSAVAAVLCVALSGAMIARSSLAYLRQAEYARWPSLAEALEPSPGYLAAHPAWQMRQVRSQLGDERPCLIGPENALAIGGHRWDAAVVVERDENDGGGFSNAWQPGMLFACRSLLLLPNDFPPPDRASELALIRCGVTDAAGPEVAARVVRCP